MAGHGDLHDRNYDHTMKFGSFRNVSTIDDGTEDGIKFYQGECPYSISVYSSELYEAANHTNTPAVIAAAVTVVFMFTIVML